MKKEKQIIAIFDFDGTLTTKDTFLEFIIYVYGRKKLYYGILINSIWIILMKLNLYPNWKAKQRIFSWFFKDMPYNEFIKWGYLFIKRIDEIINFSSIEILNKHLINNHTVYVISASIDEWVRPWCYKRGIKNIICTQVSINKSKKLTGKFLTSNCNGQEKVNRFTKLEPKRDNYTLYAYGNSIGDKEILEFSDYSHLIKS